MTDLEKHVNQPGRAKLVKQVRAKIDELGVEYIFFQFISVTGRVVGKVFLLTIGRELVKRVFNWFMEQQQTCLSIVTVIILVMGQKLRN